jgi:hypothetical protein
MQVQAKKWHLISFQKVVSKTKRDKFRSEELIGSRLARNFLDEFENSLQNFDLIGTNINYALWRSLRKEMFNQDITSMWGFLASPNNIWDYNAD